MHESRVTLFSRPFSVKTKVMGRRDNKEWMQLMRAVAITTHGLFLDILRKFNRKTIYFI